MRTTIKHLQSLCDQINTLTGSPMVPYADGKANVGNYHISRAYGRSNLHMMANESGGISTPLGDGGVSTSALADKMRAFIAGIRVGMSA